MRNILAYAGCILQFQINDNGYLQINIFNYDPTTEKFTNNIEKPLIPSITMKSSKCTIVGSCLIDKGLLVLLQLVISNSSALVCLQFQSRPWICQIVYTLSLHGSAKFLATNSYMSIFIDDEKCPNGFYLIDNQKNKGQKKIEFISCALLTYLCCYLQNHYYWLMGHEIDSNTNEKTMKVNRFRSVCKNSSVCFRFIMGTHFRQQPRSFLSIQINSFLFRISITLLICTLSNINFN